MSAVDHLGVQFLDVLGMAHVSSKPVPVPVQTTPHGPPIKNAKRAADGWSNIFAAANNRHHYSTHTDM